MKDIQWLTCLGQSLLPIANSLQNSSKGMKDKGWRQIAVLHENLKNFDFEHCYRDYEKYRLELAKGELASPYYQSEYISDLKRDSEIRYRKSKHPIDLGLTQFERSFHWFQNKNRYEFDTLKSDLAIQMEEAIRADLDTKLAGYSSGYVETKKSSRWNIYHDVMSKSLEGYDFYLDTAASDRMHPVYSRDINERFVLSIYIEPDSLEHKFVDFGRVSNTMLWFAIVEKGVTVSKWMQSTRFKWVSFFHIFPLVYPQLGSAYSSFGSLAELEINLLANLDLFKTIYPDLLRSLEKVL